MKDQRFIIPKDKLAIGNRNRCASADVQRWLVNSHTASKC